MQQLEGESAASMEGSTFQIGVCQFSEDADCCDRFMERYDWRSFDPHSVLERLSEEA